VRLPLQSSSAATVEATWLPVTSGMLPMPHLLLPDIPHQVRPPETNNAQGRD